MNQIPTLSAVLVLSLAPVMSESVHVECPCEHKKRLLSVAWREKREKSRTKTPSGSKLVLQKNEYGSFFGVCVVGIDISAA